MGRDAPLHAVFGDEIAMRLMHQQKRCPATNQPPNCDCGRTVPPLPLIDARHCFLVWYMQLVAPLILEHHWFP